MFRNSKIYFLIVLVVVLLGIGFFSKSKLDRFISQKMQENVPTDIALLVEQKIENEYNYVQNNKDFDFTFLEFSSTDCAECEKMESVLETIRNTDKVKVNVVFMHIMKPENQDLMKYYGVSAVPLQILLNNEGKEFYRHYGFISAEELLIKFKAYNQLK